jgi:chemotaxis protein methyltransferase CheR
MKFKRPARQGQLLGVREPVTDRDPTEGRQAPFVGSEISEGAFAGVREILLQRLGFDLGMYKDGCVKRRIAIRVRALGFADAWDYLEILRRDPEEVEALMQALTIHVSQFFRNPSTFVALEKEILPTLIDRAIAAGQKELRLWSVGCAGGEEPFSLAMLVDEISPAGIKVTILGTDLSGPVLERAAQGLFDAQRLAEVPPRIRERYFLGEGRELRLLERIRTMVRFQRHDVLNARVFPDADLILCRNVLIYFSREEQERILSRFAAALPAGGYLVLGKAETLLGSNRKMYRIENPAERIYRRIRRD